VTLGTSRNLAKTIAPTDDLNRETWMYVYLQVDRKSR
jgi:hypothetical protein